MARGADARGWRGGERSAAAWSASGPAPSLPADEREAHDPEAETDQAGDPRQQRLPLEVLARACRHFGRAGAEREAGDQHQRTPAHARRPVLALESAPAVDTLPTFAYPSHLRLS